ncbi:xanthine dehydrogenase family protein molybdopterin-binding subunit, partial [bacterium]|nr:xanthine dehydrogenase family protein molybdopterin-binding subunit [bacterium]
FLTRAGLTLAIVATPSSLKVLAMGPAATASDVFSPGTWLQITPDNQVTILLCKSEMGQGIHTAIPMIVADELEADWSQVKTEMAPVEAEYADPVINQHGTFGSMSLRNMYEPLRHLGAAGREILVEAAAKKWNVPVSQCEAIQGKVHHKSSGRSFSYGELVEEASLLPVPENPRLKQKSEFKLMGTPVARRDIPAKVSGEAKFGLDTFVPGMLYGVVARPPAYGAKVSTYDEQAAKKVEGVQQVVKIRRGIGILADRLDAAWKGREALNAKWDSGTQPKMSTESVDKLLAASLDKAGASARSEAGVQEALASGDKRVRAQYFLPYLSHTTMEPMDCTAHVQADRCDVWAPTQTQSGVQQVATRITGLKPEQIQVHTPYLGGGYGGRGAIEGVQEAVTLSKATGNPIKVVWTREEDIKYEAYRPGYGHRIDASLDKTGKVAAWSHRVAGSIVHGRGPGPRVDSGAVGGLRDLQYDIPNIKVDYIWVNKPIPVRPWRNPSGSHNGFTVESFMDELAHAANQDPVEFRLRHLEHDSRHHRVVELAAEKAGWGKPLTRGQGRGIATFYSHGSYVTGVAEVSVDRNTGVIQVHRVVCAVDCGPVINTDTLEAQMSGAITMGLSAALKEKVEFANGGVKSANYSDYHLLRMSEAPEVEVHTVESDAEIGGGGEPSLPTIAPAVANAVFAATGARMRRLPLTPERVLEALSRV